MWTVVFPVLPGQTGSSPDIPPVSLLLPVSVAGVEVAGEATALTVSLQHPLQALLTVSHGHGSPQVPTELLCLGESQGEVEGSVDLHIWFCQTNFCSLNIPQLKVTRDDEVRRVPGEAVPGPAVLTGGPGRDLIRVVHLDVEDCSEELLRQQSYVIENQSLCRLYMESSYNRRSYASKN